MVVYIGNLPKNARQEEILKAFEQFGKVKAVKIPRDNFTGEIKGFAFVEMVEAAEAKRAIAELNNMIYGGQRIKVRIVKRPNEFGQDKGDRRPGKARR